MDRRLTREQELALNLSCNIALEANAGSGKTNVLVERYFRIIDQILKGNPNFADLTPDNIVGITFTNKAAAEMHSRVIEKFNAEYGRQLYSYTGDMRQLEIIRLFRDKLTNARISTIHSFCLRILSNYPLEANIPVNFREISTSERLRILDDSFHFTLDNWLSNETLRDTIKRILAYIDLSNLKAVVDRVISSPDLFQNLNELYSEDFDSFLKRFVYETHKLLSNAFKAFRNDLKTLFEKCNDALRNKIYLSIIKDDFESLTELDKLEILTDFSFWNSLNNDLTEQLYVKTFKNVRAQIKKFDEDFYLELNARHSNYRPIYQFISKMLNYCQTRRELNLVDARDIPIERRYFEISKSIFNFTKEVYERFQQLKFDNNFLDFDDMLVKTFQLLKNNPEILNEVRNEIKFLLIDEFQDTDSLQYGIVQLLVPGLKGDDILVNSPNLFIVGDAKQSIYRFRNADVKVFNEAKKDIQKFNSKKGTDLHQGLNSGILQLTSTFRLKPEIAAFVDYIAPKIMNFSDFEPKPEHEVVYQRFVIPSYKIHQRNKHNSRIAPVTFLTAVQKKQEDNDTQYEDESNESEGKFDALAHLLVKHLIYIFDNEEVKIYDKSIGGFRKVRFSDIAIISRKTNDLAKLIPVLSSNNIPFIFQGGSSFFETREAEDIVAFLKFLLNPTNDVPLIAILRSTFFCFTDELLLNIATVTQQKTSFWKKLHLYRDFLFENTSEEIELDIAEKQYLMVSSAIQILCNLLDSFSILPINEVIQRIISETNWLSTIQNLNNRDQILANVDELLDYAREYVNVGFRTVWDFISDMDYLKKYGATESDHFGSVSSDAVKLLTIHASKGLEFPVVYIYRIDAQTRRGDSIQVSKKFGLIFPFEIESISSNKDIIEPLQERMVIPNLIHLIANYHNQIEDDAEERRILYVALTRSSDYLIITGELNEQKKKNEEETFLAPKKGTFNKIVKVLKNFSFQYGVSRYQFEFPILILDTENPEALPESTKIDAPLDVIVDIFTFDKPREVTQEAEGAKLREDKLLVLGSIESELGKKILSSTQFNTYLQNPETYVKTYILGLPTEFDELSKATFSENIDESDHLIVGSLFGSAIHYCLENINQWYLDDTPDVASLNITLENFLFANERLVELEIQNRVVEQCINVTQTPFFLSRKERILRAPKEFKVILPFMNNYLLAKIDLFFQSESGNFEIWDWKSNNINSFDEIPQIAEHYRFQMLMYSYLASRLYPEQDRWVARLLFTRLARSKVNDNHWTYTFTFNKCQLEELELQIETYIKQICTIQI